MKKTAQAPDTRVSFQWRDATQLRPTTTMPALLGTMKRATGLQRQVLSLWKRSLKMIQSKPLVRHGLQLGPSSVGADHDMRLSRTLDRLGTPL